MNALSVSWTVVSAAWRSPAIRGSAGRYMSIDNGPKAERPPSTRTNFSCARLLVAVPSAVLVIRLLRPLTPTSDAVTCTIPAVSGDTRCSYEH